MASVKRGSISGGCIKEREREKEREGETEKCCQNSFLSLAAVFPLFVHGHNWQRLVSWSERSIFVSLQKRILLPCRKHLPRSHPFLKNHFHSFSLFKHDMTPFPTLSIILPIPLFPFFFLFTFFFFFSPSLSHFLAFLLFSSLLKTNFHHVSASYSTFRQVTPQSFHSNLFSLSSL